MKTIDDYSLKNLELYQIADIIRTDWKNINYAAKPYLQAMSGLCHVDDSYGFDSGRSIVTRFLANASTWRGVIARAIKKELKSRL
jgi:hypothetical protein